MINKEVKQWPSNNSIKEDLYLNEMVKNNWKLISVILSDNENYIYYWSKKNK